MELLILFPFSVTYTFIWLSLLSSLYLSRSYWSSYYSCVPIDIKITLFLLPFFIIKFFITVLQGLNHFLCWDVWVLRAFEVLPFHILLVYSYRISLSSFRYVSLVKFSSFFVLFFGEGFIFCFCLGFEYFRIMCLVLLLNLLKTEEWSQLSRVFCRLITEIP